MAGQRQPLDDPSHEALPALANEPRERAAAAAIRLGLAGAHRPARPRADRDQSSLPPLTAQRSRSRPKPSSASSSSSNRTSAAPQPRAAGAASIASRSPPSPSYSADRAGPRAAPWRPARRPFDRRRRQRLGEQRRAAVDQLDRRRGNCSSTRARNSASTNCPASAPAASAALARRAHSRLQPMPESTPHDRAMLAMGAQRADDRRAGESRPLTRAGGNNRRAGAPSPC